MSGPRENMSERLEAYAEGGLGAPERAEFERLILKDPALRAEVELQQRVNERLRAIFMPPESVGTTSTTPRPSVPWARWALGIAAAIALAAVGIQYTGLLGPGPGDTRADALYTRLVRTGFEPAWECKDDAEFVAYTRDKFGQAFTVSPAAELQVLGWDYCSGVLGDEAGVLLVKIGAGDKAIVVVDRAVNDRPVVVEPTSLLHVHRRALGNAVLYEVSNRDRPAVLPAIQAVE